MKYSKNPVFPEGFLWGASSAAWQVEGATSEDGRTPAIIDLNSQTKKPYADNSVASDHYHHYKEDVALMKECGFTSYRFSISWSRVIPAADREVNPMGIAFYNNLINELLEAGITPVSYTHLRSHTLLISQWMRRYSGVMACIRIMWVIM